MDFLEFERLVLRILFETNVPLTVAHIAYLGGTTVRTAERHLARMVEAGTLRVRSNTAGQIEYFFPARRSLGDLPGLEGMPVPGDAFQAPASSPLTAVMLSMLIPGAGHIYAGRGGAGVAWMATTLMGYACCFLPGLFLHGLCMVSAAQARQT